MDQSKQAQETEKSRKRKALQEELTAAKKQKLELQKTAEKLVLSADKKAEQAEKKKDTVQLKALLIESNTLRKRSQDILKVDVPK